MFSRLIENNKVYYTIMVVFIIVFLLSSGYLLRHGYKVIAEDRVVEEMGESMANQYSVPYEAELDEDVIEKDGEVDDALVDYAMKYYVTIIKDIRTKFEEDGWKLILTDKDIQGTYYKGDVKGRIAGVTCYDDKKIYIHASKNDIRRSLIHEFGHYVDYVNGGISDGERFKSVYKDEMDKLGENWKIDDHATSNSQEYFAESFNRFTLYPDKCYEEVPITYDCIKKSLEIFFKKAI